MKNLNFLIAAGLLLTGCAQAPKKTPSEPVPPVVQAAAIPAVAVLPNVELSGELLYEYLLTEFASQRGHQALAVENSAEMAIKTRDPRLARRAAQLALESGDMNRAVEAIRFWQETDPAATMAARMLSQILFRGGRLEESGIEFVKVLKAEEPTVGPTFLQIYPLFAAYPDKRAVLGLARSLSGPYPKVAEARWMVAQLAQLAGNETLALSEVAEAIHLRPEWDAPVALEAFLLQKREPAKSLALLADFLARHPEMKELRLQYARALLEDKQYKLAKEEFKMLSQASPDSVELAFAVALISLQMGDLSGAEVELKQALGHGEQGDDAVAYFLGQLNEAKEDEAAALARYREVRAGEYLYAAQLRVAYLLNKQGQLDEARRYLAQVQTNDPARQVQVVMVDEQMLRDAGKTEEAYFTLKKALVKRPDVPEFLYEEAMLADTLTHYDESEKLLRHLIKIKPDYAHAYNALGYSLLTRNVRLAEAVSLVERALKLAPDDAAIMDSVGWGYYKVSRLDESVSMLRRAYAGNPDPEIGAHLAEVLWTRGDKEEAERLLQSSLLANPGNVQIEALIKRLHTCAGC